jgi:two-component system sensor histidine kinase RegB
MHYCPMHPSTSLSQTHLTRRFLKGMLRIRNLVVLVAALVTAIAYGVLKLHIALVPMFTILGFMAVTGVLRGRRLATQDIPGEATVFLEIVTDVLALTGLFYFSGGATNPFVWFYLFPAIVAAMVLPPAHARSMSALVVICYTFLLFFFEPIHHRSMAEPSHGFELHVLGMWLGFIFSAGFVAFVIAGLSARLRSHEALIQDAREKAVRDESMISLGTLAAGAAHELGTPLGTLAILSTDLQDDPLVREHAELGRKLELMREQVDRCKQTLSVFSSNAGAARAESGKAMSVRGYLESMLEQWRQLNRDIPLEAKLTGQVESAWLFVEPTLNQALHNLLDNAARVSPGGIQVRCGWSESTLTVKVIDEGPGIPADILQSIGRMPVQSGQGGMGVGLYLASATIRRLGGTLSLENLPQGGAMAKVTLPVFCPDRPDG